MKMVTAHEKDMRLSLCLLRYRSERRNNKTIDCRDCAEKSSSADDFTYRGTSKSGFSTFRRDKKFFAIFKALHTHKFALYDNEAIAVGIRCEKLNVMKS